MGKEILANAIEQTESEAIAACKNNTAQETRDLNVEVVDKIGKNLDQNKTYQSLIGLMEKMKDPKYTFEEFKVALSSLSEEISKNVGLSHFASKALEPMGFEIEEGESFQEKIKTLLDSSGTKEVFEGIQKKTQEISYEVDLTTNVLTSATKEERETMNPIVSLDVSALWTEAKKEKPDPEDQLTVFKEKLAKAYYGEIKAVYSRLIEKAHPENEKENGKKQNTAEKVIQLTAEQVESQMDKIDSELPLVVRRILSEDQLKTLKEAIRTNKPLSLEEKDIQTSVNDRSKDLTIKDLDTALKDLDLEKSNDDIEFLISKMETVSYGYKNSKRVGEYETYVKDRGPTALGFPDWIDQQEIPPTERFMAMIMNIIGPFMEQFNSIMGKDGEDVKDNSKRAKVIEELEVKLAKNKDEVEQANDTQLKIEGLLKKDWEGVNIAGLYGKDKDGKDIPENRTDYFTKNPSDIASIDAVLNAKKTEPLGLARTMGFEIKTLKAINGAPEEDVELLDFKIQTTDIDVMNKLKELEAVGEKQSQKEAANNAVDEKIKGLNIANLDNYLNKNPNAKKMFETASKVSDDDLILIFETELNLNKEANSFIFEKDGLTINLNGWKDIEQSSGKLLYSEIGKNDVFKAKINHLSGKYKQ